MRALVQAKPPTTEAASKTSSQRSAHREVNPIYDCERTIRNRALQPKLFVNPSGDSYEQEADCVAKQVVTMQEPQAGNSPGKAVQAMSVQMTAMSSSGRASTPAPDIVDQVLRSPGEPLNPSTRAFMGARFGHNFAQVRVHTDAQAAESAQEVNARAYTAGHHIVFAPTEYSPFTATGRELLAHELTHVIQQSRANTSTLADHAPTSHTPVQRANGKGTQGSVRPDVSYRAHPAALEEGIDLMSKFQSRLSPAKLEELSAYKTVAIGIVVDNETGDPQRVWTANGDWNDSEVADILKGLGVTRWDPGQSRRPRGAVGAPGDAEQRMLDTADDHGYTVKVMIVSRKMCSDCRPAVADYETEHGPILVREMPLPKVAATGGKPPQGGAPPGGPIPEPVEPPVVAQPGKTPKVTTPLMEPLPEKAGPTQAQVPIPETGEPSPKSPQIPEGPVPASGLKGTMRGLAGGAALAGLSLLGAYLAAKAQEHFDQLHWEADMTRISGEIEAKLGQSASLISELKKSPIAKVYANVSLRSTTLRTLQAYVMGMETEPVDQTVYLETKLLDVKVSTQNLSSQLESVERKYPMFGMGGLHEIHTTNTIYSFEL